jgi:hypothetical protein
MTTTATDTGSAATAEVLAVLRGHKADREAVDVAMAQATIEWALLNEADPAECVGFFAHRALPVAGPGAPVVSEFALMEYAAALGVTTESGQAEVGRVLELRYRLPRLWELVVAGKLPLWRAGKVAQQTTCLPEAGAAQVDRHLAPVAHSCSWAQVERTVEEAMVRFDPEAAEAKRREAAESRHVDVLVDQVGFDGTVLIDGRLDLSDALDLEEALRAGARQQADLGSTESLDVRRSIALGDLARRQLAFGFDTEAAPGRSVVLYAHLGEGPVARYGNTRSPISVDQIREWCGDATRVVVKPVIDLNDHLHVEAYEAPDRLKDQNALVDVHCVFPHCTQPAARCDTNHVTPYTAGGTTCSDNTAPLCRRHHRAKTHSAWDYSVLSRGTYLWTTPNGLRLIRDHRGTHPVPGEP